MQKVSIIIPCYNKEKYIEDAIKSALNQTYQNIEIVCIDDCSTDNSKTILKALADKYNNIILLEEDANIGVCRARNKAIDIANGEYILPLDADDTLEPSFVEKAINILDKNDDIDVVSCCVKGIDRKISQKFDYHYVDKNDIAIGKEIIISSAVMKKSDFITLGGYKEELTSLGCEDWDLWLTFLENGLKIIKINEFLYNYTKLQHSRTKTQLSNINKIRYFLIQNHKKIFDEYINNVFEFENVKTINNKYLKYKKLFNMFLIITIVETLIIIICFVCKIFFEV